MKFLEKNVNSLFFSNDELIQRNKYAKENLKFHCVCVMQLESIGKYFMAIANSYSC